MFYEKSVLNTMLIGEYRNETMQIISGYGKQKIHFEAPCNNQTCVKLEMDQFLSWFNAADLQDEYTSPYIKTRPLQNIGLLPFIPLMMVMVDYRE